MSRALFLQHDSHFGPGRIGPIFRDFGIVTDVVELNQVDAVPRDLDEVRVLVVLGGKPSFEAHTRQRYFASEVAAIKTFVDADRPVIGIGLGAQLLAHVAGGKVSANMKPGATPDASGTPVNEFGFGPITLPFPGGTEPVVFGLIDGTPMFHWHTDTFTLPALPAPPNAPPPPAPRPPTGNSLLASSRATRHQAFRFKQNLFGFQFHFEFELMGLRAMIDAHRSDLAMIPGSPTSVQLLEQVDANFDRYQRAGRKLTNNLVQFLKAY